MTQVMPHRRMKCNIHQQIPIVAESMFHEHIIVGCQCVAISPQFRVSGHYQNFRKCACHLMSEQIVIGTINMPPGVVKMFPTGSSFLTARKILQVTQYGLSFRKCVRGSQGKLIIDPSFVTQIEDILYMVGFISYGCLDQKSARLKIIM